MVNRKRNLKTRLAVENNYSKTTSSEKVALTKTYKNALKKVGVLTKYRHSKSGLFKE